MAMGPELCGTLEHAITSNPTYIRNPNYEVHGYPYLPDTDCTFVLRKDPSFASPIYFLVLNFLTSASFDIPGTYPSCETDYLEITVGETNPKIFKYCGTEPPFPVYSYDGVIKYRIVASSDSPGGRFTAQAFVRHSSFASGCPFSSSSSVRGVVMSPSYPRGYKNATCDKRLALGSSTSTKNVDIRFFDISLNIDSTKGSCESGTRDYVEVRGTPYISIKFEDAQLIGVRKCGEISDIYTLRNIDFDYVYIRFHFSGSTYNETGTTASRGVYASYIVYDVPKSDPDDSSVSPLVWVGLVCAVILGIIFLWIIIYKVINSKKQKKAVAPIMRATSLLQNDDGYVPNIPDREQQQQQQQQQPQYGTINEPAGIFEIPDYNPAELFAAKRVELPPDELLTDQNLSGALFANTDKTNDLISGLTPGYRTSQYESRTAGVMTPMPS